MIPRFLHRLYANVMGYFWLPCPNCGRMFGGHEFSGGCVYLSYSRVPAGFGCDWFPYTSRVCCPRCPSKRDVLAYDLERWEAHE